jgi:hypothetical protein
VFFTHLIQMVSFQASHSKTPRPFPFSHTCHMPSPSRPPLFNHSDNIQLAVQIVMRRTVQWSPVPCHLLTLTSKYLHYSRTLAACVLPWLEWQTKVWHPDKPTWGSISLYLSVGNADNRSNTKHFGPNGGSDRLLLSSGVQFWLFRSEFHLCAAQNIPFAYVLTSGQLISAVLHRVFVQVKARNVRRLFKIQKVVTHGVTLQRHSPIKHYCKLQNKKYNRNSVSTLRNLQNLLSSKGRHSPVLSLHLCPF